MRKEGKNVNKALTLRVKGAEGERKRGKKRGTEIYSCTSFNSSD